MSNLQCEYVVLLATEVFDIGSESAEKTLNPLSHNASEKLLLGHMDNLEGAS